MTSTARQAEDASNDDALIDSPAAWRRLALSLLVATIGGVALWSGVVVLPAVQEEFGSARGGASLPYAATMISIALGGVAMGRLADRFGVSVPVAIGAVALGVGYVLAALAPALWVFVLVQGVFIGFLGGSTSFGPLVADISHWFRRRRGIAVAICASGNYLGGALWPPITQHFVETVAWRATYVGIGIFCVLTMLPLALMLRRRPPALP